MDFCRNVFFGGHIDSTIGFDRMYESKLQKKTPLNPSPFYTVLLPKSTFHKPQIADGSGPIPYVNELRLNLKGWIIHEFTGRNCAGY